ncbi:MAG TPA: hypothetical protein DCY86_03030 [Bdellovibrionales bacterium]|nr:hypothetical protein [Bdellovibrionales bacterium]
MKMYFCLLLTFALFSVCAQSEVLDFDFVAPSVSSNSDAPNQMGLIVFNGEENAFYGRGEGSGASAWNKLSNDSTSFTLATKSGDYQVTDTDGYSTILVNDTSPNVTITLPAAASNTNRKLIIKNVSTEKGKVTIDGYNSEVIDGRASIDLDFKNASIEIHSDGTSWSVLSTNLTAPQKSYSMSTSGTNWTQVRAQGTPWRNMDGNWYLTFTIRGTFSPSTSGVSLTVTDITTKNTSSFYQLFACGNNAGSAYPLTCYCQPNSNVLEVQFATTAVSAGLSGTLELESKPVFVE